MSEEADTLKVAIVGGGPGCRAIVDMILSDKLRELRMRLLGVACTNPGNAGLRYAQAKGFYTTADYHEFYHLEDLDMIIELTGRPEVANEICRTKPPHVRFMDHVAARLFWDVFRIEEQRLAERRLADEELLRSRERYYTALEASPDPLVVYDMEGRSVYINRAFTRVFGWTPGELLGKKIKYVPPENEPETRKIIESVCLGQNFSSIESRRYTKDGRTIDVSISAAIHLNKDGAPVGSVHILRDITERKRMEAELAKGRDRLEQRVAERTAELAEASERLKVELSERKRAEEALRIAHRELEAKAGALEAANEELSQYAYVVSHDLKAPLRAIQNYADFLHEDLEETLDGEQRKYIDGLKRAAEQGTELVEDLLQFSRVGRSPAPIRPIDLQGFFEELISSLDLSGSVRLAPPPGAQPDQGEGWPKVEADPMLLRQVFQDLIKNGLKFNHSEEKWVEIGFRPGGAERCEIYVRDNGIGIDPRYHEQIFGVFKRLHTRDEYDGTGLGLAIVKKAATKLGGTVRLESKVGGGTTFFITLPKAQQET